MLLHLSGPDAYRIHGVLHHLAVGSWGKPDGTVLRRRRRDLAEWPEDVLRAYAATGECDDKAGSYAIQGLGSFLVSGIKGQWATIVGLPRTCRGAKAYGRGRD